MQYHAFCLYILVCFTLLTHARTHSDEEDFSLRESDEVVLNARNIQENLGMHTRDLRDLALSIRKLDHLEARITELEARGRNTAWRKGRRHPDAKNPTDKKEGKAKAREPKKEAEKEESSSKANGPVRCPCGKVFENGDALLKHERKRPGHWKR